MLIPRIETQGCVLAVDDNPLVLDVLRILLQRNNFEVQLAADGEAALSILRHSAVDLVICDIMMPRLDGYGLHAAVRADPALAHIPIVFLSALGDQAEVLEGKSIGADDYLTKPFKPDELLAVVKGKIQRARALATHSEARFDSYRKRVVHVLSHEFRTPLVAINTGTELLLERKDSLEPEKIKDLLEAIQRGGQRLERLVTDFMLLQQLEAGIAARVFTSRAHTFAVHTFFDEWVEDVKRSTPSDWVVEVRKLVSDAFVYGYEPYLADVVDRLVSNAKKFSPKRKELTLGLALSEGEVIITVADRGSGIDQRRVGEALGAFGQVDRDTYEQQGSGLGLAIANRYAALFSGKLSLTPRDGEGGGTVARVHLPAAPAK
jgi:two-component system sensor histidine kinase/response regulator